MAIFKDLNAQTVYPGRRLLFKTLPLSVMGVWLLDTLAGSMAAYTAAIALLLLLIGNWLEYLISRPLKNAGQRINTSGDDVV